MSGEGAGIIVVPVVLCAAAPIIVTGLTIAAAALAVKGAVTLGAEIYKSHQKAKEKKQQELLESGVAPEIAKLYNDLVADSNSIASLYNTQTQRIIDDIEGLRSDWNKTLQDGDVEHQIQFHQQLNALRQAMSDAEARHAKALQAQTDRQLDEQERQLRLELIQANERMVLRIQEAVKRADSRSAQAAEQAAVYEKSARELLKVLRESYEAERFCANELRSIETLLSKGATLLDAAPAAAYAVFWDALENELLAMNKAENAYQEWLMQYRIALNLAEEVRSTLENEASLGYLVGESFAPTMEEARHLCAEKGLSSSEIHTLKADEYVYGDLERLQQDFQALYARLHENGPKAVPRRSSMRSSTI